MQNTCLGLRFKLVVRCYHVRTLQPVGQSSAAQQCILDQCEGSRKPFPEDKDQTFLQTL